MLPIVSKKNVEEKTVLTSPQKVTCHKLFCWMAQENLLSQLCYRLYAPTDFFFFYSITNDDVNGDGEEEDVWKGKSGVS